MKIVTPQCLIIMHGCHGMQVWKLPESKAWSPDEWLVAKGHQVEEAAATPAAEPTPSVKLEGTTRRGSLIRQSSAPTPAAQEAAQAKAGGKAAGGFHAAAVLPILMLLYLWQCSWQTHQCLVQLLSRPKPFGSDRQV